MSRIRYAIAFLICLFVSAQAYAYNPKASQIATDTTNFDGSLNASDTDVQKALEKLDDFVGGAEGYTDKRAEDAVGAILNNSASIDSHYDTNLSKMWFTINNTLLVNWNNAFSWGNHSLAGYATQANLTNHTGNTSNPHNVTKPQVGLSNVTDDAQIKKIASSVANNIALWDGVTGDLLKDSGKAIADFATAAHNHTGTYEPANANIQAHISSTANPHTVTKGQVGLGNVENASVYSDNLSDNSTKDLSDWNHTATPTNGQVPKYNSARGMWEPGTDDIGAGGGVTSVFGRTGVVVANNTDYNTTLVQEGTNLYFTNERVDDRVAALLVNSENITWTYDDVNNTLKARVANLTGGGNANYEFGANNFNGTGYINTTGEVYIQGAFYGNGFQSQTNKVGLNEFLSWGVWLTPAVQASAGAPHMYSPIVKLSGYGWDTNTSTSQEENIYMYVKTASGDLNNTNENGEFILSGEYPTGNASGVDFAKWNIRTGALWNKGNITAPWYFGNDTLMTGKVSANTTKEDNGQTAFGWGNHATAGYQTAGNVNDTINNTNSRTAAPMWTLDSPNATLDLGATSRVIIAPDNCTITGWAVWGNAVGNTSAEVWVNATADPTVADKVSGTAPIKRTAEKYNLTGDVSTWTTTVVKDSRIALNITAADNNYTVVQIRVRKNP